MANIHRTCLREWRGSHEPGEDSFLGCLACGCRYKFVWDPVVQFLAGAGGLAGQLTALFITTCVLITAIEVVRRFSPLWSLVIHHHDQYYYLDEPGAAEDKSRLSPVEILGCASTLILLVDTLILRPCPLAALLHVTLSALITTSSSAPLNSQSIKNSCNSGVGEEWLGLGSVAFAASCLTALYRFHCNVQFEVQSVIAKVLVRDFEPVDLNLTQSEEKIAFA